MSLGLGSADLMRYSDRLSNISIKASYECKIISLMKHVAQYRWLGALQRLPGASVIAFPESFQ